MVYFYKPFDPTFKNYRKILIPSNTPLDFEDGEVLVITIEKHKKVGK